MIRALILDYGDVLSWPQSPEIVSTMARRAGVSAQGFRAAYRQHRDPYDAGVLPARKYWQDVLGALGRPAASAPTIEWFIQRDVESWTRYREEVWAVARLFRARGGRTAMLSNCPSDILTQLRADRRLTSWFDVVVASCEVGCIKPDPQIFKVCLSDLDVTPDQVLFVDDLAANIEAAARLGFQTMHFAGRDPVGDLRLRLGE